jgi:transcriptional regulator with XRE-family HTH domain
MWIATERHLWQSPLMEDRFPRSRSKEDIGYRLKLTREALGHSQALIARTTGIATSTWNNYEKGIRRPSVDEAFKIVSQLHLPIGWIYDGDTTQMPAELLEKIYSRHREQISELAAAPSQRHPKPHRRRPFRQ